MEIDGITFIENLLATPADIFDYLKNNVAWDGRMAARKTASYGVAYNYSQMSYPFQPLLLQLQQVCNDVSRVIGFEPNNCLINYYLDGKSKMGFHSDQTDILEAGTGVAIVSLGETRVLRFRNIEDNNEIVDYQLPPGSLIYMTQSAQQFWQHAIPESDTDNGRMSLTLRRIVYR